MRTLNVNKLLFKEQQLKVNSSVDSHGNENS